jgi:FPC/CPF motif-containing protein YcgG
MAVFDTHKAFEALTAAGFTERQAQALIDVGGEGYGVLATKTDIADMATKTDMEALELRLTATLERRMNNLILQLALLQVAVGGLIVAALKFLP